MSDTAINVSNPAHASNVTNRDHVGHTGVGHTGHTGAIGSHTGHTGHHAGVGGGVLPAVAPANRFGANAGSPATGVPAGTRAGAGSIVAVGTYNYNLIPLLLKLLSLITVIVAISAVSWSITTSGVAYGAYRYCVPGACGSIGTLECSGSLCHMWRAVQAFVTIGTILSGLVFIYYLVHAFSSRKWNMGNFLALAVVGFALLSKMLAVAIWGGLVHRYYPNSYYGLGYGFLHSSWMFDVLIILHILFVGF